MNAHSAVTIICYSLVHILILNSLIFGSTASARETKPVSGPQNELIIKLLNKLEKTQQSIESFRGSFEEHKTTHQNELESLKAEIISLKTSLTQCQEGEKILPKAEEPKERNPIGPIVDLGGQIVVNLRGLDGRNRLLRTSLSIEVDSEETKRAVESKLIMIRYGLTRLLSSRRPEEVIGATQLEQIRASMRQTASAILGNGGKVINVWPNDWILE